MPVLEPSFNHPPQKTEKYNIQLIEYSYSSLSTDSSIIEFIKYITGLSDLEVKVAVENTMIKGKHSKLVLPQDLHLESILEIGVSKVEAETIVFRLLQKDIISKIILLT